MPPPQPQPSTPYEAIGGSDGVDAVVAHFYDLIDADPAYEELRALHAADLSHIRHGLASFLKAWLGGPKDWFGRGLCAMSLHRRFPIDQKMAEHWANAMARAISAQSEIDKALGRAMAERLGHMARGMINRADEEKPAQRT